MRCDECHDTIARVRSIAADRSSESAQPDADKIEAVSAHVIVTAKGERRRALAGRWDEYFVSLILLEVCLVNSRSVRHCWLDCDASLV